MMSALIFWYAASRSASSVEREGIGDLAWMAASVKLNCGLAGLEERPDEVVRIAVVARPPDHVQLAGRAGVNRVEVVGVPRRRVRLDGEADGLEIGLHELEVRLTGSGM